jgi:hypothetical protein
VSLVTVFTALLGNIFQQRIFIKSSRAGVYLTERLGVSMQQLTTMKVPLPVGDVRLVQI